MVCHACTDAKVLNSLNNQESKSNLMKQKITLGYCSENIDIIDNITDLVVLNHYQKTLPIMGGRCSVCFDSSIDPNLTILNQNHIVESFLQRSLSDEKNKQDFLELLKKYHYLRPIYGTHLFSNNNFPELTHPADSLDLLHNL